MNYIKFVHLTLSKISGYLLYLLAALLPWTYLLPLEFSGVHLIEPVILASGLLGLVVHIFRRDEEFHFRSRKAMGVYLTAVLFLVSCLLSVLFAINAASAIINWLRLLEAVILMYLVFHSEFSVHTLARFFISSSTVLSLAIIFGLVAADKLEAAVLVVGAVMILGLLFTHHHNTEKVLSLIAAAIHSIALSSHGIASHYMYLAVALAIVLMYLVINHNHKLLRLFTYYILIGLIPLFLQAFAILPTQAIDEEVAFVGAQDSRMLSKEFWGTGAGVGNYLEALGKLKLDQTFSSIPLNSTFLVMLVEVGVLGTFFFLILLFEIIKIIVSFKVEYSEEIFKELTKYGHGESYFKDYGYTTHWYVCLSGMMVATVAWMALDHIWWTNFSALLLWWFCLGLWLKMMVRLKT